VRGSKEATLESLCQKAALKIHRHKRGRPDGPAWGKRKKKRIWGQEGGCAKKDPFFGGIAGP